MIVNNVNEWYKVMNIRYYEHLQEVYNIVWSDTSDKEGKTLLETQVKVSEIMTETNKKQKIKHTLQPLKLSLPKTKHYIS